MKTLVSSLTYDLPDIQVKYYFYYEEDKQVTQKVHAVVVVYVSRINDKARFGASVLYNEPFRGVDAIEQAKSWLDGKVRDFRKNKLNSCALTSSIGPAGHEQGPRRRNNEDQVQGQRDRSRTGG